MNRSPLSLCLALFALAGLPLVAGAVEPTLPRPARQAQSLERLLERARPDSFLARLRIERWASDSLRFSPHPWRETPAPFSPTPRFKLVQAVPDSLEPDELEPNDVPEKATAITLGDSISSRIWQPGDEDYYHPQVGPL
ncbi:MAG: hypothetical protein HYW07_24155 [Candidatus Latescibacteria bacterium]|nr:hypothetical protein [Candidatus Latescibacterota bacterium]